jgi:hypothetical protein
MTAAKWMAALYCAVVLGLQSWAIFSTSSYNNRHWPLVNYPMYSRAHAAGEQIHHLQMVGRRCRSSADSVLLGAHEIGMMSVPLSDLVRRSIGLIPGDSARAAMLAARLRHRVQARVPGLCALEVWERAYTVGRDGLQLPGPPPHMIRAWPLPGDGAGR